MIPILDDVTLCNTLTLRARADKVGIRNGREISNTAVIGFLRLTIEEDNRFASSFVEISLIVSVSDDVESEGIVVAAELGIDLFLELSIIGTFTSDNSDFEA